MRSIDRRSQSLVQPLRCDLRAVFTLPTNASRDTVGVSCVNLVTLEIILPAAKGMQNPKHETESLRR